MHLLRFNLDKRALRAFRARQEIVAAGITRRELMKMGLLTASGYLVTEKGLSREARGATLVSPRVRPFVQPLRILPVLPQRAVGFLNPAPTIRPNRATNPATGLPFEGRTEPHQSRDRFPAQQFHITRMAANRNAIVHPELPPQTLWGFNLGGADFASDPARYIYDQRHV